MRISFSPFAPLPGIDETLSVSRSGDTLTINGDTIDLTNLANGATLPAEAIDNKWISRKVHRIDGEVHVTIRLPHGPNAPESVRFPADIIDPPDGPIAIPGQEE